MVLKLNWLFWLLQVCGSHVVALRLRPQLLLKFIFVNVYSHNWTFGLHHLILFQSHHVYIGPCLACQGWIDSRTLFFISISVGVYVVNFTPPVSEKYGKVERL